MVPDPQLTVSRPQQGCEAAVGVENDLSERRSDETRENVSCLETSINPHGWFVSQRLGMALSMLHSFASPVAATHHAREKRGKKLTQKINLTHTQYTNIGNLYLETS